MLLICFVLTFLSMLLGGVGFYIAHCWTGLNDSYVKLYGLFLVACVGAFCAALTGATWLAHIILPEL